MASAIRELAAALDRLDEAAAAELGLGRSDLAAMEIVSRHATLTAGQLAEQLRLTTGAVTGVVDRMEAMGYFRRRHDPGDGRKVMVELTAKARAGEEKAFDPIRRDLQKLLGSYGAQELKLIADFLEKTEALVHRVLSRDPVFRRV